MTPWRNKGNCGQADAGTETRWTEITLSFHTVINSVQMDFEVILKVDFYTDLKTLCINTRLNIM